MNKFNEDMQINYQMLKESMDNGSVSFDSLNDASNTSIDNAYKGTAQETQALTVKDMIGNLDFSKENELALKIAIGNIAEENLVDI